MSVSLNDRPNRVTVSGDSVTVTTGSGVQGPQGATGATGAGGAVAFFGNFFSTETQPNVDVSAANTFTLNSTVDSNGVSIVDGSKITFAAGADGTYDLQFSIQFDKTDSGTDEVDVWLSKNGTDEEWSNTVLSLVGNNAKVVAAWNFQLNDVVGGDFFELHWWSPDADMRALASAAGSSPTRPAVPSIILTVAQVTYTQLGPTGATGPQGPQGDPGATGDPGVAVQGTAPANTSILWADTSEVGDAVVPTGGSTGQALVKASGSDYDTEWATQIPASLIDAKGDLIVGSAADIATRLAVGTNGYSLVADTGVSSGIKWAATGTRSSTATRSGASYWGLPGWCIWNGNSTFAPNLASTAYYTIVIVTTPITVTAVSVGINSAGSAGGMNRLSCYTADASWQPVSLVADWGEIDIASTGTKTVSSLTTLLLPGRYLARIQTDASATRPQYMNFVGSPVGGGLALTPTVAQHVTAMYKSSVTYGPAETNPAAWDTVVATAASASSIASMYRSLMVMQWTDA